MSNNSDLDFVPFGSREQLISNDFMIFQKHFGKNVMDMMLARSPWFTGDHDTDRPCVLGGFNVEDIDGLTVKIGEGAGFVLKNDATVPTADKTARSRAALVAITPTYHGEDAGFKNITIPSNPNSTPRLVLIYGEMDSVDTSRNCNVYNPTSKRVFRQSLVKTSVRSMALGTELGVHQPVPVLSNDWNPLFDNYQIDRLPLYAVYCPALLGETGGPSAIETGDILDLRMMYNPAGGNMTDFTSPDRHPGLETLYHSSDDGSSDAADEKIWWNSFNASVYGQDFVIPLHGRSAWESYGCYVPDPSLIETSTNRRNRPIYWYALPPIGTISRSPYKRWGTVTCTNTYMPEFTQTTIEHLFTLTCGTDGAGGTNPEHKYQLYTRPIFMGSMLTGTNAGLEIRLHGCKRCGDKLFITERGMAHSANNSDGIVLDFESDWSTSPKVTTIDLHKAPATVDQYFLPKSAKGIMLIGVTTIDNDGSPMVKGDSLKVSVAIGETDDIPAKNKLVVAHQIAGMDEFEATQNIELPVPFNTSTCELEVDFEGVLTNFSADSYVLMKGYVEAL